MIRVSLIVLGMLLALLNNTAQRTRPVTALDCVQTKYLLDENGETAIRINEQGTRVAYLVKSPNIATNDNDIALYVGSLNTNSQIPVRLITSTPRLSHPIWLADGKHIAALAPFNGRTAVVLYDTDSSTRQTLASASKDIEEYSIDSRGDTVVYALRADTTAVNSHSQEEIADGYRIPSDSVPQVSPTHTSFYARYQLFVKHRSPHGAWLNPTSVPIHSPFDGHVLGSLQRPSQFGLSLSPDGRELLANVADIDMHNGKEVDGGPLPKDWTNSPTYQRRRGSGGLIWVTLLQNLSNGQTTSPVASPALSGMARWSPDGKAFYAVGVAPVASSWEIDEKDAYPSPQKPYHLWRVEPDTGHVQSLLSNLRAPIRSILWVKEKSVGVRTGSGQIAMLETNGGEWKVTSQFHTGSSETATYGDLASNGTDTVVDYQRSDVPPELHLYKTGVPVPWATIRLNPQLDSVGFAPSRKVHWKTLSGVTINGSLLIPPGYDNQKRYPLVIQTKPQQSAFVCDAGSSHMPSFAPQPMATQGLLYLAMEGADHTSQYPSGYPGGVGEAVFYADVWDSAVRELDRLGMVDPNKVGIIGFSRSGWYTEFALTHGHTRFAAATATDNVQYSLGEYWLQNVSTLTASFDAMYGGPPYGDSLENWKKYSISFNTDRIHTPLLMEVMGNGAPDESLGGRPANLSVRFEIVNTLNHLKRPVELYYYPDDEHQPEHPRARLASLKRNIDWYRFWLQGYERPSPADPKQYTRWRLLRQLQEEEHLEN